MSSCWFWYSRGLGRRQISAGPIATSCVSLRPAVLLTSLRAVSGLATAPRALGFEKGQPAACARSTPPREASAVQRRKLALLARPTLARSLPSRLRTSRPPGAPARARASCRSRGAGALTDSRRGQLPAAAHLAPLGGVHGNVAPRTQVADGRSASLIRAGFLEQLFHRPPS